MRHPSPGFQSAEQVVGAILVDEDLDETGGTARVVVDPSEAEKALRLIMQKYPAQLSSVPLPMPTPSDVRIFRVTPVVVSVLDYSKGFGHTDLVIC